MQHHATCWSHSVSIRFPVSVPHFLTLCLCWIHRQSGVLKIWRVTSRLCFHHKRLHLVTEWRIIFRMLVAIVSGTSMLGFRLADLVRRSAVCRAAASHRSERLRAAPRAPAVAERSFPVAEPQQCVGSRLERLRQLRQPSQLSQEPREAAPAHRAAGSHHVPAERAPAACRRPLRAAGRARRPSAAASPSWLLHAACPATRHYPELEGTHLQRRRHHRSTRWSAATAAGFAREAATGLAKPATATATTTRIRKTPTVPTTFRSSAATVPAEIRTEAASRIRALVTATTTVATTSRTHWPAAEAPQRPDLLQPTTAVWRAAAAGAAPPAAAAPAGVLAAGGAARQRGAAPVPPAAVLGARVIPPWPWPSCERVACCNDASAAAPPLRNTCHQQDIIRRFLSHSRLLYLSFMEVTGEHPFIFPSPLPLLVTELSRVHRLIRWFIAVWLQS